MAEHDQPAPVPPRPERGSVDQTRPEPAPYQERAPYEPATYQEQVVAPQHRPQVASQPQLQERPVGQQPAFPSQAPVQQATGYEPVDYGRDDHGHLDDGYGHDEWATAGDDEWYGDDDGGHHEGGWLSNRRASQRDRSLRRARAREARWAHNRMAVPYPTDGPKITFGVLWFLALVGSVALGAWTDSDTAASVALIAVVAPVAALAGLQTGNAWFPSLRATRSWTAGAAFLTALPGLAGVWGVPIGLLLGLITLAFYVMLYRGHRRSSAQLFDVLARSAIPVGVAAASLVALSDVGLGAKVGLILLVSAYEAGDFVVGSGSSNAFEGPLAGLVGLSAVAFLLFLVQPAPFDQTSVLLFAVLAAVCCPLGQILASGLLPRGNAWAPALRRLDSYLLAAPVWLLLGLQLPAVGS